MALEIKKLGEVATLVTGGTPSRTHPEYFGGSIRWLVSGDIHSKEIFECKGRITEDAVRNSNARLLPLNSVMIALNGQGKTRGTVAILRTEATCNQSLVAISPKEGILLPEYLFHNLNGRYLEIRALTGQDKRQGLNMQIIRNIEIPLPSIEAQRKTIARIEKVFAKIEEITRLRVEAEAGTSALLHATLNETFSQIESKGWTEMRFSDVVKVESKRNLQSLPYVGMEDVESGTGRFLGSREIKTVKSATSYFHTEHVLYGKLRPYLNKVLVPDFEGHSTTEFLPLRPDASFLTREWLAYWLQSGDIVKKISATGAGTRMPRANMKEVAKFNIPLPSLAKQREIVKKLDVLSEKIYTLQALQSQQATNLKTLKQSILQEAFS